MSSEVFLLPCFFALFNADSRKAYHAYIWTDCWRLRGGSKSAFLIASPGYRLELELPVRDRGSDSKEREVRELGNLDDEVLPRNFMVKWLRIGANLEP